MKIARNIAAFFIGGLFGLGLCISQMANPEKVLAFLNLGGDWDPSLAVVMGAAVAVSWIGFRLFGNGKPLLDSSMRLPVATAVDQRLILGAVLFGLGWGLAGYCPGPAITALSSGLMEPLIFVLAMIVGGQLARFTARS